nr:hypothetical protein Itr_chr12CG06970 [Ipomoea trifida]
MVFVAIRIVASSAELDDINAFIFAIWSAKSTMDIIRFLSLSNQDFCSSDSATRSFNCNNVTMSLANCSPEHDCIRTQ